MDYRNPHIPEGINTAPGHKPLTEAAWLLVGAVVVVILVTVALTAVTGWLAKLVPFSQEKHLAARFAPVAPVTNSSLAAYLDTLKQRLARQMEMPEGMDITLHYVDDETVNAFATLGGHVVLFRGLLEKMPDENTLAMVLAHEMAHIKHRDPIVALGRGTVLASVLASIFGRTPAPLDATAMLTLLNYNRRMELAADAAAARALYGLYGHLSGSQWLFQLFEAMQHGKKAAWEAFFQTHPLNAQRLQQLRALADRNHWPLSGKVTPLPPELHDWL